MGDQCTKQVRWRAGAPAAGSGQPQLSPPPPFRKPALCACCGWLLGPGELESGVVGGSGLIHALVPPRSHRRPGMAGGQWGDAGGRRRPHAPAPPVAVVVVLVVAAQGRQAAQADGEGEEDLGARVHPHLHGERQGSCTPGSQGSSENPAPSLCRPRRDPAIPMGSASRDPRRGGSGMHRGMGAGRWERKRRDSRRRGWGRGGACSSCVLASWGRSPAPASAGPRPALPWWVACRTALRGRTSRPVGLTRCDLTVRGFASRV